MMLSTHSTSSLPPSPHLLPSCKAVAGLRITIIQQRIFPSFGRAKDLSVFAHAGISYAYLKLEGSQAATIRDICKSKVPEEFLLRAEQIGYVYPTNVQAESLPVLLSGQDCILHSQTGSGKTLCFLFAILAKIKQSRSAVQAIVVVPTRELGMQVVREARKLGKQSDIEDKSGSSKGSLNIMTLLDGGSLSRQKVWLKADPPQIIIGTLLCICRMIETKNLKTNAVNTLVIDEVDAMFGMSQHVSMLRMLLSNVSSKNRQTIFASATIPQHSQFIRKCVAEKWLREDVVHVQVSQIHKMPESLIHRHVLCDKNEKLQILDAILRADKPNAAIIFVSKQSEASKRKGLLPSTELVADFLASSFEQDVDSRMKPLVLHEEANINARTSILAEFPHGKTLLLATDLAGRGLDIPEVTHIYNYELPATAIDYVHRGGRTARKPFNSKCGTITTLLTEKELFVYQRYQNEIMFESREHIVDLSR